MLGHKSCFISSSQKEQCGLKCQDVSAMQKGQVSLLNTAMVRHMETQVAAQIEKLGRAGLGKIFLCRAVLKQLPSFGRT